MSNPKARTSFFTSVCLLAGSALEGQNLSFTRRDSVAPLVPRSVFVADFNRDGKADLAVNNVVLLGNGDGTFSGALAFADSTFRCNTTVCPIDVVAVDDFNRDGKPDLALSDRRVLLGNGDGSFKTAGMAGANGSIL